MALVGVPLFFILLSTVLQLINPEHNPFHDAISELARGPYGQALTAFFYILSFSVLILVVRLFRKPGMSLRYKIGVGMISISSLGFIFLGAFPTDLPGEVMTFSGTVHMQTTAVIILLFAPACFLIAPGLRRTFRRGWLAVLTHSVGVVQLVLITAAAFLVAYDLGWVGMLERMIVLNSLGWMQVVSIQTLLA